MELARTFDTVAAAYDAERSGYPDALFGDLMRETDLVAGAHVLEVGCGSGQATTGLLDCGLEVTAIDPGPALIDLARKRFPSQSVSFHVSTFETWPVEAGRFDLIASAQAWHWIDPQVSYVKAAEALAPNGWLAVFGHTPAWSETLLDQLQPIYQAIAPQLWRAPPESWYLPEGPVPDLIETSGRFGKPLHRRYDWVREFTPASFAAYLGTRSDHNVLSPDVRARLLSKVEQTLDGAVTAHWVTNLYFAQRLPA